MSKTKNGAKGIPESYLPILRFHSDIFIFFLVYSLVYCIKLPVDLLKKCGCFLDLQYGSFILHLSVNSV